jgi:hypothetical protein
MSGLDEANAALILNHPELEEFKQLYLQTLELENAAYYARHKDWYEANLDPTSFGIRRFFLGLILSKLSPEERERTMAHVRAWQESVVQASLDAMGQKPLEKISLDELELKI